MMKQGSIPGEIAKSNEENILIDRCKKTKYQDIGQHPVYAYNAFGLAIRSQILLPELMPSPETGNPDVTICYGEVPDVLEDPKVTGGFYQATPHKFLFKISHIAKYLILDGTRVIVEKIADAPEEDVRVFLLSSVFAALMQERGCVPLHASSIRVGDGSILFCGNSGSGKSTTADTFMRLGYGLRSDDISAVTVDGTGMPVSYPSFPRIKLAKDAMIQAGKKLSDFKRTRQIIEKYTVPAHANFDIQPLPVRKIYILSPHNKKTMELIELSGFEKFNQLRKAIFRWKFAQGLGKDKEQFKIIGKISEKIPVKLVKRPNTGCQQDKLAAFLEKDVLR